MHKKDILKKPIITEKSMKLIENQNKYTFKVDKTVTKGQIKNIISETYGVTVTKVRIAMRRGRLKRSMANAQREEFKTKDVKKAIVEIKDGETISVFNIGNN